MIKTYTADEVRELLRRECDKAGSVKAWAKKHNMSPSLPYYFLSGERPISGSIERALGFTRVYQLDGSRNVG